MVRYRSKFFIIIFIYSFIGSYPSQAMDEDTENRCIPAGKRPPTPIKTLAPKRQPLGEIKNRSRNPETTPPQKKEPFTYQDSPDPRPKKGKKSNLKPIAFRMTDVSPWTQTQKEKTNILSPRKFLSCPPPKKSRKLTVNAPVHTVTSPFKTRGKAKSGHHKIKNSSIDSIINRKSRKAIEKQHAPQPATLHQVDEEEVILENSNVIANGESSNEILAPGEESRTPPLPQRAQEEIPPIPGVHINDEPIHEILAPREEIIPLFEQFPIQPSSITSPPAPYLTEQTMRDITIPQNLKRKLTSKRSVSANARQDHRRLFLQKRKQRVQLRRRKTLERKLSAQRTRYNYYLALKAFRKKQRMESSCRHSLLQRTGVRDYKIRVIPEFRNPSEA